MATPAHDPARPPRARDLLRHAVSAIIKEHRAQPFDLLHGLWLYESGAAAVIAARILRLPVIVSIGGAEVAHLPAINYGMRQSARGRAIVRGVLRAATVVTGGSNSVLALADAAAGRHLVGVRIPLPIDASAFAAYADAPRTGDLVQVAAPLPVKHQTLLLEALQIVQRSRPGTHLTIYGEDPLNHADELLAHAGRLGISDVVTYAGRVPHSYLPAALAGHWLHVQTSLHESQGLGVLEAAAAGIPSVGTNVGVLRDLAPEAAHAIPHPDPTLLAAAIVSLLRDDERLANLRTEAMARVAAEYDVGPVVDQWLALYQRVAARRAISR